ncbi:MAG: AraC family transcriptional regulator [Pseudoclavibacter sp.]
MSAQCNDAGQTGAEEHVLKSLRSYQRFATRDLSVAESEMRQFMSPGRLHIRSGDRKQVDARAFFADTGPVGVGLLAYGADVLLERRVDAQHLGVAIPLTGRLRVWQGRQALEAVAGQSLVVVAAEGGSFTEWSAGSHVLILAAKNTALTRAAAELSGETGLDQSPRFVGQVLPLERGHAVYSAARLLADVIGRYDDVTSVPRRVLHRISDHVLNAMLFGLDHDVRAPAKTAFLATPSRAVRTAIQLIDDEFAAEFNVSELARRVGISIRALELGFRRALDQTPHEYMSRSRLRRARRDLLDADTVDGTTVTDIATRWGFLHSGRFVASYKAEYGVMPSVTLSQIPAPSCDTASA